MFAEVSLYRSSFTYIYGNWGKGYPSFCQALHDIRVRQFKGPPGNKVK